jgi:hypothetical protein
LKHNSVKSAGSRFNYFRHLRAGPVELAAANADNARNVFAAWPGPMLSRKLPIAAICLLAVAFTATGAMAHGFGGFGGFGHGFFGGHFHDSHGFHGHDFHHVMHHGHYGHHWATHFHYWDGSHLGGHFGPWHPGHWHTAFGFGSHGHWSPYLEGVWGR